MEPRDADAVLERAASTEARIAELTDRATRTTRNVVLGSCALWSVVGAALLIVMDAPGFVKAVTALLVAFAWLIAGASYWVIRRVGGEWAQPALLLGADPKRRRRVKRALLRGRPIDAGDLELVVDLHRKLRLNRWVLLVSGGYLFIVSPLRFFFYSQRLPAAFRVGMLVFIPIGICCIAQQFWLYHRACQALDAADRALGTVRRGG